MDPLRQLFDIRLWESTRRGEDKCFSYRAPAMKVSSVRIFVRLLICSFNMTGIGMTSMMKSMATSVPITDW